MPGEIVVSEVAILWDETRLFRISTYTLQVQSSPSKRNNFIPIMNYAERLFPTSLKKPLWELSLAFYIKFLVLIFMPLCSLKLAYISATISYKHPLGCFEHMKLPLAHYC